MSRHAQKVQSKKEVGDEWRTPDWVFEPLQLVFGFTVDAAATSENAKCGLYWTEAENGLVQDWANHIVFNNPPFTSGAYGEWIRKAAVESYDGNSTIAQVLPFNPETAAFAPVWDHASYLILPRKRIAFDYPDGTPSTGPDAYHVIVIWNYHLDWFDKNILDDNLGRVLDLIDGFGYLRSSER